jgi:SAM-dependent methyltransferase
MSLWYTVLYRLGITPWESDQESLTPQITSLIASEETRRAEPYGPALDLGCGTGHWSILLAKRGWDVTGVDVVPKAIDGARDNAVEEGLDITFVVGDVSDLRGADVGEGYSFFLDVECFNHLSDEQRLATGAEIDAVASDEATLLMLAWKRARRGPLPPGVNREDLETALPNWEIVEEHPYSAELPPPLRSIQPRWYRLEKA